jgi:hypothetical protein
VGGSHHIALQPAQDPWLAILGLLLIVMNGCSRASHWHWPFVRAGLGLTAGLVIGVVSNLFGVAGGELIIPTLVLLFGLDIKLAGLLRYRSRPVFHELVPQRRLIVSIRSARSAARSSGAGC